MKHTLDELLMSTHKKLKTMVKKRLVNCGYEVVDNDGFLYAEGNIPILLCVHLDTVFRKPPTTIVKSDNIAYSPEGIGGDDRCGVYIALKLLEDYGLRPYVLFTEEEEKGFIGARKFCRSGIKPNVKFILSFDRHGFGEAVFYDCKNKEFKEYITDFGLKEERGYCADISYLAPFFNLGAVNVSCAYYNEHTLREYIRLDQLEDMVFVGRELLSATPPKKFTYKGKK